MFRTDPYNSLKSFNINFSLTSTTLCLVLLSALFFIRLFYIPFTDLALFYDEAYYHFWSQHLDFGYYSKPPMVAWLIALTTGFSSLVNEWSVKIGAPLLYSATTLVIYKLGQELFEHRTAVTSAIVFFTTPLVTFNSLFITTDAPLLFFWALTCLLFVKALKKNQLSAWVLAGVAGGFGLLSKYTMIFLLFGFVLYLITTSERRKVFSSAGIWCAILVALLVFSPNLIWNLQHDFISFQHTSDISKLNKTLFHPDKFAEFFTGQFLVFGPVCMWMLLVAGKPFTAIKKWSPSQNTRLINSELLLFSTLLPLILTICCQALLARAHLNWAAPIYVSASLLVANRMLASKRANLLTIAVSINLFIGIVFYGFEAIQKGLDIEPKRTNNPFHRVSGWRELNHKIAQHPLATDNQIWLSDSRKILSYLHFYHSTKAEKKQYLLSFNPDRRVNHHFDLEFDINVYTQSLDLANRSVLYLSESKWPYRNCFESTNHITTLTQPVYPALTRTVYLYKMTGFKGYKYCEKIN